MKMLYTLLKPSSVFRRCAPPDGIARRLVLPKCENQRHVDRHSQGAQLLERTDTGWRRGHFNHPILMALAPTLSQLDVPGRTLLLRQCAGRIFQERIKLEAYVTIITFRALPNGQKHLLGRSDDAVGHLPRGIFVAQLLFVE